MGETFKSTCCWKFFCRHEMRGRISRRKTKTMGETKNKKTLPKHPDMNFMHPIGTRECLMDYTYLYLYLSLNFPLCLWHDLQAFVMITMPLVWSPCLWQGHHALGMVTMPLAWSPCLWHGHQCFSRVTVALAKSPCFWHGDYAFGRVTVP